MTQRAVTRYLRRMLSPPHRNRLSDSQLLERFVSERDEAAFEVLLWRHGPKVLGVCRRVLHQEQDAEDAFQATILILVRKAGSISSRQSVGSWLYQVAYRVALRAQAQRPRRQGLFMDVPARQVPDRELDSVLDEEVNRLPEKYRAPFLLCCLEGKTNEEAARELGCPAGTVKSRLAWARQRLRTRLAQRGVTLSEGWPGAQAVVPAALVESTLQSMALGKTVAGPAVTLSTGVLHAMLWTKVKLVTGCVLTIGALGVTGGALTQPLLGTRLVAEQPEPTPPTTPNREDEPQPRTSAPLPEKRISFEMRDKPWLGGPNSVLEWLSDLTGRPVAVSSARPTGTFTFVSPRNNGGPKLYSLAEVIDILNSELRKQQLLLVCGRDRITLEPLQEKKADQQDAKRWFYRGAPKEKTYTVEFRNTPWSRVLAWLVDQTGLPCTALAKPTGELTLVPPIVNGQPKQYTISELTDLLNQELARQKLFLIRGQKSWSLGPLDRVPEVAPVAKPPQPAEKGTEPSSVEAKLDRLLNRLDRIETRLDRLERSIHSPGPSSVPPK